MFFSVAATKTPTPTHLTNPILHGQNPKFQAANGRTDQTSAEGIPADRCGHLSAGSSEEVERHDLSVLLADALITSTGQATKGNG